MIVRSTQFPRPRPDVHGPPSSAGFGISRVLGSAGSSRHTANRRGGRSPCTTESRRSKGGSLWKVWCPWMLDLARSVAALNVDRADTSYPATDPGCGGGSPFPGSGILFPSLGVTGGGGQSAVIDLGDRPSVAAHLWVQLSFRPVAFPQTGPPTVVARHFHGPPAFAAWAPSGVEQQPSG